MKRTARSVVMMIVCVCAMCGNAVATDAPAIDDATPAREVLALCRQMIPREDITLSGTLTVRKRRGIELGEYAYTLTMRWGMVPSTATITLREASATNILQRAEIARRASEPAIVQLFDGAGVALSPRETPSLAGRVCGTDVTWMDLTLDFLWWTSVADDAQADPESRTGQKCRVLFAAPDQPIPGCSGVRIWIDRKTGCMVQAEQLNPLGDPVRRMWVQRIKKMDGRWMVRVMEIETLNSGHRTKLFVEDLKTR